MADPILDAFNAYKPTPADALGGGLSPPPVDPILKAFDAYKPTVLVAEEKPPATGEGLTFPQIAMQSFGKGAVRATKETAAGVSAAAPAALGGTPLAQQPQLEQEPKDDVDRLLNVPTHEGFTNPKWWLAQAANTVGASIPGTVLAVGGGLAGAGAGTLAAGPPGGAVGGLAGGAAGFALGSALQTVVPAYQRAKADGLSDDDAMERAIVETGVAASFGAIAGLAPGGSIYGRELSRDATGKVANILRRPFLEALTQMGIVQPSISTAQAATEASIEGRTITPSEALSTFVFSGVGSIPFVGAHAALSRAGGALARGIDATASPEGIERAFEAGKPVGGEPGAQPVMLPAGVEHLSRMAEERPTFYSTLQKRIEQKGPASATAARWAKILEGVEGGREEQEWLRLPQWLADAQGNVSKQDLVSYIEEHQVRLEEKVYGGPTIPHPGNFGDYARERGYSEEQIVNAWNSRKDDMVSDPLYDEWDKKIKEAVDSMRRQPLYEDKTLPGPRENPREILMKLPMPKLEVAQLPKDPYGRLFEARDERGNVVGRGLEPEDALEHGKDKLSFTDPHWKDRNVLGWTRVDTRTDREGKRSLVIHEIQLGENLKLGQKVGFKGETDTKGWTASKDPHHGDMPPGFNQYTVHDAEGNLLGPSFGKIDSPEQAIEMMRKRIESKKAVNVPFKTNTDELLVKRILRMAADEGHERIVWNNAEQQIARYPGLDERQQKGMREFYGSGDNPGRLGNLFKKWANRLGMEAGETRVDLGHPEDFQTYMEQGGARTNEWNALHEPLAQRMRYVDVSPAASDRIRMGLPLHSRAIGVTSETAAPRAARSPLMDQIQPVLGRIDKVFKEITGALGIKEPLHVVFQEKVADYRGAHYGWFESDKNLIRIGVNEHKSLNEVYATLSHEFGHFIDKVMFAKAPDHVKLGLLTEFNNWLTERPPREGAIALSRRRDNALSARVYQSGDTIPILEMSPEQQRYWHDFGEWKAEQVARWMTTSDKPLSIVDRHFSALARIIRDGVRRFRREFGLSAEPTSIVKDYLDSRMTVQPYAADIYAGMKLQQLRAAIKVMEKEGVSDFPVVPQQPETMGSRIAVDRLFASSKVPDEAAGMHVAMDKFSDFTRWTLSLPQIAQRNRHIPGLQAYKETRQLMDLRRNGGMQRAYDTLQALKRLGTPQRDALSGLVRDHQHQTYLKPAERAAGVERRPTQSEFTDMVRRNGVGNRALLAFTRIQGDYRWFLEQVRGNQIKEANKLTDPVEQGKKIEEINDSFARMTQRDFFPQTRYGEFTYTVRDAADNLREFRTFESQSERDRYFARRRLEPGQIPDKGRIAKDASPLLGMPPGLLDSIEKKLALSTAQRKALEDLRYEYSPGVSFKHHLRARDNVPGWSDDFIRSYTSYMFHGMNHLARTEYADILRGLVEVVRAEGRLAIDHDKRDAIANYMAEHLQKSLDPKPDWAILRGIGSMWALGYSAATATLNLSQLLTNSGPHFAAHFGDVKGWLAMGRAVADRATFFKKATLTKNDTVAHVRMMGELIREGMMDENLAAQLAANAEGRNLLTGFGRNAAERALHEFLSHSMDMFQLTEGTNRRVTGSAALKLAMENPNNRHVQQAIESNPILIDRMLGKGYSPAEAAALAYAKEAYEQTQFIYAQYARPKFMQGRVFSNVFLFKSFVQNTLFFLGSDRPRAVRSLLVMGALGGLMGIPLVSDIASLVKLGAYLFGKDFDLEDQVRDFVTNWMKGGGQVERVSDIRTSEGGIRPDVILHGLSRVGYGIPQLMEMMSVPFPTMDRSRSIGLGNILPVDLSKLVDQRDAQGAELGQVQNASGAVFGLGFGLMKALTDSQLGATDLKRWEPIMPRFAGNASQAFRYWSEGMERNRRGAATVRFDPYDATQMMEVLARAAGYQPARKTIEADLIGAQAEASAFWDLRRQGLLRQAFAAQQSEDPAAWDKMVRAIENYNEQLPEEAKGKSITSAQLRASITDRLKGIAMQEQGLPTSKRDIPLYESVRQQYPEASVVGSMTVK